MTVANEPPSKPAESATPAALRREREAAALRANLQRRKQQSRSRAAEAPAPHERPDAGRGVTPDYQ